MISIFADQATVARSSYSIYLSAALHCIVILAVSTVVTYTPPRIVAPIRPSLVQDLYMDSQLIFHRPPVPIPGNHSVEPQPSRADLPDPNDEAPGASSQEHSDIPRVQVQPERVPRLQITQDIPLTSLVVWSPPDIAKNVIHAPLPKPPVDTDVTPLILETPIINVALAQIPLVARDASIHALPLQASTTSILNAHDPNNPRGVPEMASLTNENSPSARVLSLSNALATNGPIALLQANIDSGPPGASRTPGTAGNSDGQRPARPQPGDANSVRRVTYPKDGKFGMVVVGASLEELYPTAAAIWKGKIVYTVYLSVGMGSKWILQYARASDTPPDLKQTHLEAPWPTDLVVPNLPENSLPGPLIVHGQLEKDGTLDRLAVVSPRDFELSAFVLNALQQWHFRPAKDDGYPAALEILLIIS